MEPVIAQKSFFGRGFNPLFLILGLSLLISMRGQEPLTNDSIIKMVKAGLSQDVIISMVRTQPAKYDLTPDQLIALKSVGVPDRVVSAMVESGDGSRNLINPFAGTATGATPAPGTVPAGDPNNPMSRHDSGIYISSNDGNDGEKLILLEQAAYQGSKMGGTFGAAMTYGIKKIKMKAIIPGQHASIRTGDTQPVFYFYFDYKAAGLGKGVFGAGNVSNPNQFALVKLEVTHSSRETTIGEFGAWGSSSGTSEKSMIPFKSEELREGVYKVTLIAPMKSGDYCFVVSPVNAGALGAGAAGLVQIFDFGVAAK